MSFTGCMYVCIYAYVIFTKHLKTIFPTPQTKKSLCCFKIKKTKQILFTIFSQFKIKKTASNIGFLLHCMWFFFSSNLYLSGIFLYIHKFCDVVTQIANRCTKSGLKPWCTV
ncbi:hypothetical protein EGW08_013006 [Elysia chlorotica]|uniref:Uncharacterized protein n=1 Tax=Elysia chlorotica TaxID=188477 RepID=A0A433TC99_ELYCH|nr:hypothetical protein EGW08_013006 [Elysia chlorotica]